MSISLICIVNLVNNLCYLPSFRIVSVDISKEWPEKRFILTGSIDGAVKQWSIENLNNNIRIKSTQSHDIHQNEREVYI